MSDNRSYEAVVIGSSWGGLKALSIILSALPENFNVPILVVQHQHKNSEGLLTGILKQRTKLEVLEGEEKELIEPGCIYLAPAGYHMLIEPDRTISLSSDELINYSRPSVDVLFESAVEVYRDKIIGVVLTGANSDGAEGIKKIKKFGGLAIVQDPKTAEADVMPKAAIKATSIDYVESVEKIAEILIKYTLELNK